MSTLLIIDVQETYRKHCSRLINELPEIFQNHDNIYYLWDNGSGESLFEQVPEEWLIEDDESTDSRYNQFNKTITKQYGFFRDFMDSINLGYPEEDIVQFGKFMISKGISDSRDIVEDASLYEQANAAFKLNNNLKTFLENKANLQTYIMTIPYDLIEELKNGDNYILVGGGINECLEEVRLLMEMIGVNYSILHEYTY